ncbi:unnamed protein product, partial [marine sediment metagenome]
HYFIILKDYKKASHRLRNNSENNVMLYKV